MRSLHKKKSGMAPKQEYEQIWMAFLDIKAQEGYEFDDLIDLSDCKDPAEVKSVGAWGNVLVRANNIKEAIEIIEMGLHEKKFEVKFIDSIKNFYSLVEEGTVSDEVIQEADWLYSSGYRFMISDRLWTYLED